MPGLDHLLRYLVRWNGGGNEDDLVKMKCLPNLFSTPKVTQMNGIERPAQ